MAFTSNQHLLRNTVSTASPSPLMFPMFPQLPVELQLKIYRFTFPQGRVIELHMRDSEEEWYTCLYNQTPIALQICRASRQEALLAYRELSFPGKSPEERGLKLYINLNIDTIYISPISIERRSVTSTLTLIAALSFRVPLHMLRSLAIEDGILLEILRHRPSLISEAFPSLQKLIVVSEFLYQGSKTMGPPTQVAVFDFGIDLSGMQKAILAEITEDISRDLPRLTFRSRRPMKRRRWQTSNLSDSIQTEGCGENSEIPDWLGRSLPRLRSLFSNSSP